ncbi:MAG: SGNH/GDSL hydrolase family protein [Lentisphaerae bacterium]|nr:SGNH/GDSL hydrolase family protein [Lentisphaerota bacterium]
MEQAQIDFEKISQHLKSKASAPWTWVFYGDSITHGAAHTRGFRSFPEIFAERLRWEMRFLYDVVINTGISGQSTVQLLDEKRYDWRVRRFKPDAVLILIGMNDTVKVRSAEKYRDNLISLVRRVRDDGAIPVLQTNGNILHVPENDNYMTRYEKLPEYNQVVRQVASTESVILVDHEKYWNHFAIGEEELKLWLGEAIHPGGKGHLEMAKCIFQTLDIYDPESSCCNPVGTPWSLTTKN